MPRRATLLLPLLLLACAGCTFYLGRAAADRTPAASAAGGAAADAPAPNASPSHDQICSQLRADIASSQHNQRGATPATQSPIIAAAGNGKEDQRIEALQKRYETMGCVAGPRADDAASKVPRAP